MLRAIAQGKSRGSGLRGNKEFVGAEDLLTAAVFSRIAYLSEERIRQILEALPGLSDLLPPDLGRLEEVTFWPRLRGPDGRSVEPDVLLLFTQAAFLVEAKRYDGVQQQNLEQLTGQQNAAAHELELGERPLIQLAIGGNREIRDACARLSATEVGALVYLRWQELQDAALRLGNPSLSERRLGADIALAFNLHGIRKEESFSQWLTPSIGTDRFPSLLVKSDTRADVSPTSDQLHRLKPVNISRTTMAPLLMSNDNSELSRALLDVRKAYRLLHGYHRRVLDTAALLAEQFSDATFHRTQLGCSPFTARRNPFERTYWVWDATPLVSVSFLYVRHLGGQDKDQVHRPGDYLLDISFVADSEYTNAVEGSNREPDPEGFLPPEDSASYLVLLLIRCERENRGHSWISIWNEDDYPDESQASTKWGDQPYQAFFQKIPMELLADQGAVTRIGEEFKMWALGA